MERYGNINVDEFTSVFVFYIKGVMLCNNHMFVFSLENSFPIVLSGEVYPVVTSPLAQALYLTRQHYWRTVPSGADKTNILT